jgi:hypothetical protein
MNFAFHNYSYSIRRGVFRQTAPSLLERMAKIVFFLKITGFYPK